MRRKRASPHGIHRCTQSAEHSISIDGRRCSYLESGARSLPVLMGLHGLISHAGAWDGVARGLSDRWRVIAPDLRGHAGSEWSSDYSQGAWVDDVVRIADALALPRFALAGHLMGARIAWLYAARHPERVERLAVIGLAPMKPRRFPPLARDSFASLADAASASRESRYERTPGAVYAGFLERFLAARPDGRLAWRYDPALRAAPEDEPHFAATVDEQWAALRAVRCPTLILHAADDGADARARKQEMVRAMSDARLVEIAGVRDLLLDDAAATASALRAFLEGA